ncbi:MAG: DUF4340 domain-containing protein [Bdellovibrionales bacterium]|nr:DUF4340 domain-containing protein [Bdellovibrionales bacterium]
MSQRNFFGLIALLIVTFGVFWASKSSFEDSDLQPTVRFLEHVNSDKIQEIVLTRGEESLTIAKQGGIWTLPAKDGYPADPGKVRSLLLSLFELKSSQKITDQEDHYARLGVTDESVKEGKAKIELRGPDASTLAGFYVGDMRKSRTPGEMPGMSGQYVREIRSSDVYLIGDRVPVIVLISNWLLRNLSNILPKGIEKVTQFELEGSELKPVFSLQRTEHKEGEEAPMFALDSAEGEKPQTVAATQVQTGLENMRIVDVLKDGDATKEFKFDRKTQYVLNNGLVYSVTTAELGEKFFAKLSVEFDPTVKPLEGDKVTASSQEDAEKLNQQYVDWVFELPKYLGQKFRVSRAALLSDAANAG